MHFKVKFDLIKKWKQGVLDIYDSDPSWRQCFLACEGEMLENILVHSFQKCCIWWCQLWLFFCKVWVKIGNVTGIFLWKNIECMQLDIVFMSWLYCTWDMSTPLLRFTTITKQNSWCAKWRTYNLKRRIYYHYHGNILKSE